MNKFTKLPVLLFILFTSTTCFSQVHPTFDMTITNVITLPNAETGADSILQFDIFIKHTNSSDPLCPPFEFGASQFNITFNPELFENKSTVIKAERVAISGGINFPASLQNPSSMQILKTGGDDGEPLLQISANIPDPTHNFIVSDSGNGNRILRIKLITNQHSWPMVQPDLKFQLTSPNNTFITYFTPSKNPDEPDSQSMYSLMDTVKNHYRTIINDTR